MNLAISVLAHGHIRAGRSSGDGDTRSGDLLNLAIANLADRNRDRSCDHLGLAIGQSGDDSSLYNGSADNLAIWDLRSGSV